MVPSPAVGSSDVGTSRQALTSEDGPWFAANGCYKSGDSRECWPNWGNGGTADYNTKTSFFQIAPYSPGVLYVRLQYQGNMVVIDPVFEGEWKSWWMHSSTTSDCCGICACGSSHYDVRHHRYDVLAGEGKGFHMSYAAKWNCHLFDCH